MKYSEYSDVRRLLETDVAQSYGYDLNEWSSLQPSQKMEQLEHINEAIGIASVLGGILAGLFGIGVTFRKKLLSLGVKKIYMKQLTNNAKKFKATALDGLQKAIKPSLDAKNKIKRELGANKWEDIPKDKQDQITQLEKNIDEVLKKYVSRVESIKNDEVNKKIEGSKRLSASHKSALKYVWMTLSAEVETSLLSYLMTSKIIESPSMINMLQTNVKEKTKQTETNIKSAWDKIKNPSNEKEQPTAGDKYIIEHEKLGGKKEVEITSVTKEEIKLTTKGKDGKQINMKITPENFKNLKKEKVETKTSGEGDIIDKEI